MGIDLILKVIGEPLVLAFLIASALRPAFRRYPYAILYIAGMLVSDVVRESVLIRFGLTSREYLLAYFLHRLSGGSFEVLGRCRFSGDRSLSI